MPRRVYHVCGNHTSSAVEKTMNAVTIAFEFVGNNKPEEYKVLRCHVIFDVKTNLTRKARVVAEGNLATPDANLLVRSRLGLTTTCT